MTAHVTGAQGGRLAARRGMRSAKFLFTLIAALGLLLPHLRASDQGQKGLNARPLYTNIYSAILLLAPPSYTGTRTFADNFQDYAELLIHQTPESLVREKSFEGAMGAASSTFPGIAVGGYADNHSVLHGYAYDGMTFETIDPPGSTYTECNGLSASGTITGSYKTSAGVYQGFLFDGTYTTIAPAGPTNPAQITAISGNKVVGYYEDNSGVQHGFLYATDTGSYTTIDPIVASATSVATCTAVSGNNIVGTYVDTNSVLQGFLYTGTSTVTLNPSPASPPLATYATGVSGNNVVGYYEDNTQLYHSFLYNGTSYQTIAYPGALTTYCTATAGKYIAGYYINSSGQTRGFVYDGTNYSDIFPAASQNPLALYCYSVDSLGSVSGEYGDTNFNIHGFVATILSTSPTITSFTPTSGPPGTAVTLTGTNYASPATISFNGTAGTATVSGTTKISTKVPVGATTGLITVGDSTGTVTSTGTFTVTAGPPVKATITLTDLSQPYTGLPAPVAVTTAPVADIATSVTYSSTSYPASTTAPTDVGSYTVTATITDPNYTGSAKGTLVIKAASATVTVNTGTVTYDGNTHTVPAVTTPPNLAVNFTYNGKTAAPSAAGTYKVVGTIDDLDYTGSGTGTLVIAKAAAVVTIEPSSVAATYTGKAIAVTGTSTPAAAITYAFTQNGKAASPVNVGSYDVTATVSTANAAGTVTGTLVISPELLALTYGPLSVPYTGKPIAVTGTTSPVKEALTFTYTGTTGSTTPPTNLGSYGVTAHLASANYAFSNSASATFTVVNPPVIATSPATPLLSAFGAQVGFDITPNGIVTKAYFEYATNSSFTLDSTTATVTVGSGKTEVPVTGFLTGLTPNTLYYYRIVVLTSVGVEYGPTESFTTLGFDVTEVAAGAVGTGQSGTGQSAPGTAFNFASFGNGIIDDFDGVAFNAKTTSTSASSNDGIWANVSATDTLSLIAQTGTAAPGANGALFTTLSDPVYDEAEDVAFAGTVAGSNPNGVWATTEGSTVALLAREGEVAPGAGTATFSTFTAVGQDGLTLVVATLKGTGVTSANDVGVWQGYFAADLTLWLRSGDQTNLGKTIAGFTFLPAEPYVGGQTREFGQSAGHFVATATYTDKSTGIIDVLSPSSITAVATSGDMAVGTGSATFATFGNPTLDDNDHTAFQATLTVGKGDAVKANAGGIWADNSSGTRQLVARLGEVAPGTTAPFLTFSDPVYNLNDAVAFRATLGTATGQATSKTNAGIWCNRSGSLALVAQLGEQAPGCPAGVTISAISELALDGVADLNQNGVVSFLATLSGTGVTSATNTAVITQTTAGELELVVRTGDELDGKTITTLSFLPVETGANAVVAGQARSHDSSTGDLLFNVTFSDKSQAIFNVVFPQTP